MDNKIKTKYLDIVKKMQNNKIASPQSDSMYQERGMQEWSGTEYSASAEELECFVDNISKNGLSVVPKIGDSEEFGNGWVQITYFHEESVLQSWSDKISSEYPDEITYRTCAYILNFQCGVSLILCIFEDLIFSEDELLRIGIKYNFYDLESESRDPSSESHGYFSEMSEDVGDLEFYD